MSDGREAAAVLLARADRALYEEKWAALADEPPPEPIKALAAS